MLDDKRIRKGLVDYLRNKKPAPSLIVEELGIHNGNAIADVVAIYKYMHGFEIKGETDSISRIVRQAEFYNLSFSRVSLVTTKNHLSWAERNLPDFWGILHAKESGGGVRFVYKRPAKNNPLFSKENSLLMLWKSELLGHMDQFMIRKKDSRASLAEKIASISSKEDVLTILSNSIQGRQALIESLQ